MRAAEVHRDSQRHSIDDQEKQTGTDEREKTGNVAGRLREWQTGDKREEADRQIPTDDRGGGAERPPVERIALHAQPTVEVRCRDDPGRQGGVNGHHRSEHPHRLEVDVRCHRITFSQLFDRAGHLGIEDTADDQDDEWKEISSFDRNLDKRPHRPRQGREIDD
ncbi:hypothetical protein [Amycolatopsis suaedae]|uniref:hypothetical protein n=1 Tax=Amycolatopsis suaedae TaxID=2510978 RepID=UPI001F0CFFEA|nr:hypothetical protein [Amycolatopsis suaedae]